MQIGTNPFSCFAGYMVVTCNWIENFLCVDNGSTPNDTRDELS